MKPVPYARSESTEELDEFPKGNILALALLLLWRRCSDGAVKNVVKTLPDRRGGEFLEISRYDEEDEEDSEVLEPRRSSRGCEVYAESAARDAPGAVGLL